MAASSFQVAAICLRMMLACRHWRSSGTAVISLRDRNIPVADRQVTTLIRANPVKRDGENRIAILWKLAHAVHFRRRSRGCDSNIALQCDGTTARTIEHGEFAIV